VVRALVGLPRFSLDVEETVVSLVYCAIALAVVAGCVARARQLTDPSARTGTLALRSALTTAIVAGVLAAAGFLGTAVIVAGATRLDCRAFRFNASAWQAKGADSGDELDAGRTARERMGAALIRCRTLHGMTRGEVRRRLGGPDEEGPEQRRWHSYLGTAGNGIGPGETQTLSVTFSRRPARVQRVFLVQPED